MERDRHQLRVLRIIYWEQSWSWIVDRRAGGGGPSSSRLSINPDPDPPRLRERQRGCSLIIVSLLMGPWLQLTTGVTTSIKRAL